METEHRNGRKLNPDSSNHRLDSVIKILSNLAFRRHSLSTTKKRQSGSGDEGKQPLFTASDDDQPQV